MASFTLLAGHPRDLGGFSVRRVLPSVPRRMVGPFIFWDHMGPAMFEPGHGLDVRPHPHIRLATVTYLFEGEIVHKDSLGSDQSIRPGELNWMTAGRGIAHSERTGAALRKSGGPAHGIQSWVALPRELEDCDPRFEHVDSRDLPEIGRSGARLRILAGTAFGETAPVKVSSPTLYVDARLDAGASLELSAEHVERAVYVVTGAVESGGITIPAGSMAVAEAGAATLRAVEPSRVMLLGGTPLGKRYIWWNFVSSTEERIEAAKREWKDGAFPTVRGDELERIPLPE